MKKRFSEGQIIGFLGEAEAGLPIKELCHQHGFSDASYYLWRSKFGGMSVPDALIEPGSAYIESLNERFRDECLNEYWFTSLHHTKMIIEAWRRECNEERTKKSLGELPPSAYDE